MARRINAAYTPTSNGRASGTLGRNFEAKQEKDPAQVDFKGLISGTKSSAEMNKEASEMLRKNLSGAKWSRK